MTVVDVPPPVTEKEVSLSQSPPPREEVVAVVESEKKVPQNLVSFKEENNRFVDLNESERKALEEWKQSVEEALRNGVFNHQPHPPPPPPQSAEKPPEKIEEAYKKTSPNLRSPPSLSRSLKLSSLSRITMRRSGPRYASLP